MTKYIALLTYNQFKASEEEDNVSMADKLKNAIFSTFGFEVPVIVRSINEIRELVNTNPFYNGGDEALVRLHLTLLEKETLVDAVEKLKQIDVGDDTFEIVDTSVFVFCTKQYKDTKLGNNFFEKKLKVCATTRNWKTVLKLVELSG